MNINAMAGMTDMIKAMLPYEYGYEPKSNSGITIKQIFNVLFEANPKMKEFEGFIGHVLKKLDTQEDTDKVDKILMEIRNIINENYPQKEKTKSYGIGEKISREEAQRYGV